MTDRQEIIINGVDVSVCKHYDKENGYCDQSYLGEGGLLKNTKNPKTCNKSPNCYYKQLQRKTAECQRMKYFLNKIRNFELESLDVDWDRYEQEKGCTDFSPIITYVEQGLGEIEEDD